MPRIIPVLVLALLVSVGFQAFGQPTPLEHPKKLFIKNEGRIYIPHQTQIYLRFTLSPDDGAKSYLLLSKDALEKGGGPLPFQLEGHGEHSIYHPREHWSKRKKSIPRTTDVFLVNVDNRAPVTKLGLPDVLRVKRGRRIIFGGPVSISVSAVDGDSGLQETYASVDEQPYAPYGEPFSFNDDSFFSVNYYAVDNVGNASKARTRRFAIDLTPPESIHTVKRYMHGDVLSPKARVRFSSKDEKAGVKTIFYKMDAGENTVYNRKRPVRVNKLDDGQHTLSYYAIDRVGNEETAKIYNFYLDRTPPEASHAIEGDQYQGQRLYVSARTRFALTATDNRAGVKSIRYRLNKRKRQDYSKPFGLPKGRVKYRVSYFAVDNVANVGKTTAFNVVLDEKPPKAKLKFEGEHFFSRKIHWVNSSTMIGWKVTDNLSGVQSYTFLLDGVAKPSNDEPFTIEKEGQHDLQFFATDNVNNKSPDKSTAIFVDMTPPEIFVHFSVKSIDGKVTATDSGGSYPRKSYLYLAATDVHAGVRSIEYKLDDRKTRNYRAPLRLRKTGERTITVTSVDNVGNVSTRTVTFTVTPE